MPSHGKPVPFFISLGDAYFRRPIRLDVLLGIATSVIGWLIQLLLRKHYGLVLTKDSLGSFVDGLSSASISTAGFVFTALGLLVTVGENYRAKFQESLKSQERKAENEEVDYYPNDGFEAFFVSDLYLSVVTALLWASIELFLMFIWFSVIRFLWSIAPDWSSKAGLIFGFVMLLGAIFRSVYVVSKVLAERKSIMPVRK